MEPFSFGQLERAGLRSILESLHLSFSLSTSVSSAIHTLHPQGTFLTSDEPVWEHFISAKGFSLC